MGSLPRAAVAACLVAILAAAPVAAGRPGPSLSFTACIENSGTGAAYYWITASWAHFKTTYMTASASNASDFTGLVFTNGVYPVKVRSYSFGPPVASYTGYAYLYVTIYGGADHATYGTSAFTLISTIANCP